MNGALQNFVSVSIPIMFTLVGTIWVASWAQSKRFREIGSDMNRRFDEITQRPVRIEHKIDSQRLRQRLYWQ